ncbi:MAG TPA: hypothetical protein VFO54_01915 [Chryseosolibacter sp.]|nr:hypothetical protein [Chryseosolibacter sp.]
MIGVFKIFLASLLAFVLTSLTQVGGLVFLLSLFTHKFINRKFSRRPARIGSKLICFLVLYFLTIFLFVPAPAKYFGRVPLPLFEENNLQPATAWTFLLNRNYVRPSLKESVFSVAREVNKEYPGTVINYLDAGFPFMDGFPLAPHLSHDDGRKLDLSFLYIDAATGKQTRDVPSFIGYGICEAPEPGEINMPLICDGKGYWQYNVLRVLIPQTLKDQFRFDSERTKTLVRLLAEQPPIGKIFIEPHLRSRLGLNSSKIRFHGCQAVRHDDHIHVQLQ